MEEKEGAKGIIKPNRLKGWEIQEFDGEGEQ